MRAMRSHWKTVDESAIDRADGLGRDRLAGGDFGGRTTMRGQLAGLLHAVSYLRWPLIFINVVVIVVKIIFG